MRVPQNLPTTGLPAGVLTCRQNLPRLQGPDADPQTAMPKQQRIGYAGYAPVHLFPGFVADTLISEACTMCRELKMSDLFYKALELLGLQEYSQFLVLVSRTRHIRVWAEPNGINRSVHVRNRKATAGWPRPPGGGGLGWGGY